MEQTVCSDICCAEFQRTLTTCPQKAKTQWCRNGIIPELIIFVMLVVFGTGIDIGFQNYFQSSKQPWYISSSIISGAINTFSLFISLLLELYRRCCCHISTGNNRSGTTKEWVAAFITRELVQIIYGFLIGFLIDGLLDIFSLGKHRIRDGIELIVPLSVGIIRGITRTAFFYFSNHADCCCLPADVREDSVIILKDDFITTEETNTSVFTHLFNSCADCCFPESPEKITNNHGY